MEYIIMYDGESDFCRCFTKEEAETQISSLVQDGYSADEMILIEGSIIEFNIEIQATCKIK